MPTQESTVFSIMVSVAIKHTFDAADVCIQTPRAEPSSIVNAKMVKVVRQGPFNKHIHYSLLLSKD